MEELGVHSLRHEVGVRTDWKRCFDLCAQVETWPRFMPAVRMARTLQRGDGWDVIELTAEFGTSVISWTSGRTVSAADRRIRFYRLDPVPPVLEMRGTWSFEDRGPNALIVLTHEFLLNDEGAEGRVIEAVKANSTRDLEAIARTLES